MGRYMLTDEITGTFNYNNFMVIIDYRLYSNATQGNKMIKILPHIRSDA